MPSCSFYAVAPARLAAVLIFRFTIAHADPDTPVASPIRCRQSDGLFTTVDQVTELYVDPKKVCNEDCVRTETSFVDADAPETKMNLCTPLATGVASLNTRLLAVDPAVVPDVPVTSILVIP